MRRWRSCSVIGGKSCWGRKLRCWCRSAFGACIRDITERKRAEESLRLLSGRLLHLQDQERRRIARELHDSAGQLLAALSMNLSLVGAEPGDIAPRAAKALQESVGLVQELSRELRTISYLLHPPLLDEVGLASGLWSYLDGFT